MKFWANIGFKRSVRSTTRIADPDQRLAEHARILVEQLGLPINRKNYDGAHGTVRNHLDRALHVLDTIASDDLLAPGPRADALEGASLIRQQLPKMDAGVSSSYSDPARALIQQSESWTDLSSQARVAKLRLQQAEIDAARANVTAELRQMTGADGVGELRRAMEAG